MSKTGFLTSAAIAALLAMPANADGIDVPAGGLKDALSAYTAQTGVHVFYAESLVKGAQTKGFKGNLPADQALSRILSGTGLMPHQDAGVVEIVRGNQSSQAAPVRPIDLQLAQAAPARAPMVETVTVTSSKLGTTDVQSIPIAITELSAEQLTAQKIEGGPDLLKSVPNMTFTKTNFSGYNIQIRGVGTQAISATTDPGVAVSFNDSGLIHNRLFEQEFFDVENVQVLRGPQGTLYGRNATGGVINVVSAKPKLDNFEGSIKGEVGNYDSKRMVGMLNVPILDDMLAIRIAGSLTKRDGYDYNLTTQNRVNGRDLWSLRTTVGFQPIPALRADFVWERFQENDNRSRTGKQLCHRDPGPEYVGSTSTAPSANRPTSVLRRALFSQGCSPGSLYDDDAFGTVNGLALPFVFFPLATGGDCGPGCASNLQLGFDENNRPQTYVKVADPYGGRMQSRDLREIESVRDPIYRANSDIFEFNADFNLNDNLTIVSQTAYNTDSVYSIQDYNRFNTDPIFTDTTNLTPTKLGSVIVDYSNLIPGGIFCDPQLGCTNKIAGLDQSSAYSHQFSQEVRLQSHMDGPFNFSVGANYTRFKTQDDYYVFNNLLTLLALNRPFNRAAPDGSGVDLSKCWASGFLGGALGSSTGNGPVAADDPTAVCPYIDPNPVESINGQGHNYFRSSNPYRLSSWAVFGETYYNINDDLKITAGLRFTDDHKTFDVVPSQLLLAYGFTTAGTTPIGYPQTDTIRQHWGEVTGRLVANWNPKLSFTDDTLVYGSYSRGYKAGGANPPSPGFATFDDLAAQAASDPSPLAHTFFDSSVRLGNVPFVYMTAIEYGQTFKPEFVNAFEVGSKNTLLNGALTLNNSAFFYDYKDYQVSQIRNRTAVNENFDAKMWGLEFESFFAVSDHFRLNANLGYLGTRIADGETSIDTMNRTQGNPNYVVAKPWAQLPSNCVVPVGVAENFLNSTPGTLNYWNLCGGLGNPARSPLIDPATGATYDVNNYPEINGGAGIRADLGGNELPNSPHFTLNVGAEYTVPFADEWAATVRTDMYWQAQSWWRVYNLKPFDRLEPWTSVNFTVRVDGPDGLAIEAYVKNAFDNTAITGAFLNSDDSGLTTNVFTTDPRLIGFSITKTF
ncbi:MAG TPA: TonB-dependent receptor [Rhizomicrobium sp.]|nr:TonB-dependent receptor [Rhizomicrobium sp.]